MSCAAKQRVSLAQGSEHGNSCATTYFGQEYPLDVYNPDVEPISRKTCYPSSEVESNLFVQASANIRLDERCSYKRLGIEIDASVRELYRKAVAVDRSRGMNISPFRRVDTVKFD
ncbi:hypothetical protein ACHAWX_000417 [Stephanocyclus meneghinianus]